jgi:hypothetical protein
MLLGLLTHKSMRVREEAAVTLAAIGRPAVAALIEGLSRDDADFRKVIVITLGLMGPAARPAVPMLRALTGDEAVGPWARRALVRIEGRRWYSVAWPWLAVAGFVLVVTLASNPGVRAAAGLRLPGAAVTAGLTLGGVGLVMGLLLGRQSSAREAGLLAASLGAGGLFAGGLLAWLIAGMVEPVVKALGG